MLGRSSAWNLHPLRGGEIEAEIALSLSHRGADGPPAGIEAARSAVSGHTEACLAAGGGQMAL